MATNVKLPKGVRTVRTTNASGRIVEYDYYGRGKGAVRLPSPRYSSQWLDALSAAKKVKSQDDAPTFAAVLTKFKMSTEFTTLKPRTKSDYAKQIDKIGQKWGSMPVSAFKPVYAKKLNGMFLDWRDELALSSLRQADYTTVVLNRILNIASLRNWIECNPIEGLKRVYTAKRQHIIWEKDELKQYYREAPHHMRLPVQLAELTGQRQGDLLKMRFHKTNGITPWYDGTHVYLRSGKTASFIKVRAVKKLKEALDAEFARAAAESPEQQRRRKGHVLVNSDGLPWTEDGFRSSFGRIRDKIGIRIEIDGAIMNKTFHDLRGTAITGLKMASCTDSEIAAITGHSEKSVGQILKAHYLGAEAERAEIAIRKLERFEEDAA